MATSDLYARLKAAGCEIDNHESDLYVRADDAAKEIINAAIARGEPITCEPFLNRRPPNIGERWYSIPFAFSPWWEQRTGNKAQKVTL